MSSYRSKPKQDLSSLFKLKIRKSALNVRINYGNGWQALKGVTSFTAPMVSEMRDGFNNVNHGGVS